MKTLKTVLLIDDSDATVFFNKIILSKTGYVDEILIAKNGLEALKIIKTGVVPDLIFLDINMPVMNGWEFLEAFENLSISFENTIIVLMIGSPLSKEDQDNVLSFPKIKEFQGKMLSRIVMDDIMRKHYQQEFTLMQ